MPGNEQKRSESRLVSAHLARYFGRAVPRGIVIKTHTAGMLPNMSCMKGWIWEKVFLTLNMCWCDVCPNHIVKPSSHHLFPMNLWVYIPVIKNKTKLLRSEHFDFFSILLIIGLGLACFVIICA